MPLLSSICWFCLAPSAMALADPQDAQGDFPSRGAATNMCDFEQEGRGLLQTFSERLAHPAFAFGEEVSASKAASYSHEEASAATTAGNGDVSSVLTWNYPAGNGEHPHRQLMLFEVSAKALRSVALLAVVIILIVCIMVVLLAGFAGSRGDDDHEEIFSSDSERSGSPLYAKSRLSPKISSRFGMRRQEPTRRMENQGPLPRVRFTPLPPGRQMGKGGSPYAPPAPAYARMQPLPSNTQMMPPPVPVAPSPETGGATARPPATSSLSKHLCSGLVVPKGSECVLAVPTPRGLNMPPRNAAAFFVRDLGGKPVIQAEILVQPSTSLGTGVGQQPIAVMRKPISQGEEPATISDLAPVLACVKASFEAGAQRSAHIYDARDEIFAHIAKDPVRPCYVLTSSRMNVQVIFTCTSGGNVVQVTNEAQELLANVEPCTTNFDPSGDYYKLRVASEVDVSLILGGLLAIDHMDAS